MQTCSQMKLSSSLETPDRGTQPQYRWARGEELSRWAEFGTQETASEGRARNHNLSVLFTTSETETSILYDHEDLIAISHVAVMIPTVTYLRVLAAWDQIFTPAFS